MWMRIRRSASTAIVMPALAGLIGGGIAVWIVRPIHAVLVGSDTASSVLYFDRILAGERLERFLGTTPKPLLTVVDGLLHGLTGDWRPIIWVALLVYALAIATIVALVLRTAGPAAGAFVATAIIASRGLLQDAAQAYAVSWALLALGLAGLALTAVRPRYAVSGIALAVGALARQEVVLVTGVAMLVVMVRWVAGRSGRIAVPSRGEWFVFIGLAALPLTAVHDLLLTGDPTYTLRVSTIGAEGAAVGGVGRALDALDPLWLGAGLMLPLAILGGLALARSRAWLLLGGLVTVVIAVAAVVLVVGARGLVVLDRYALPGQLGLTVLAGFGWSAVGAWTVSRLARGRSVRGIIPLLGVVLALLAVGRIGPLDGPTLPGIRTTTRAARDYAALLGPGRQAVAGEATLREPPATRDPTSRELGNPAVFVSARLLSQAAVDLGLHLDRIARLAADGPDPGFATGTLVLYLPRLPNGVDAPWAATVDPVTVGGLRILPLDHVDHRAWLVRIDR